ncbi:MAG: TPM domain-containing protein, partial [Bacteroidota bacterium]
MRNLCLLLGLMLAPLFLTGQEIVVPPAPSHYTPVNDYAGLLDDAQEEKLSKKLRRFERQNGAQITLVCIKTLHRQELEAFSLELAQSWGIGQTPENNGVLVLVVQEERKIRLEIGMGLKKVISKIRTRTWLKAIKSDFRKRQYYPGLDQLTDKIIGTIQDSPEAPKKFQWQYLLWMLLFLPGQWFFYQHKFQLELEIHTRYFFKNKAHPVHARTEVLKRNLRLLLILFFLCFNALFVWQGNFLYGWWGPPVLVLGIVVIRYLVDVVFNPYNLRQKAVMKLFWLARDVGVDSIEGCGRNAHNSYFKTEPLKELKKDRAQKVTEKLPELWADLENEDAFQEKAQLLEKTLNEERQHIYQNIHLYLDINEAKIFQSFNFYLKDLQLYHPLEEMEKFREEQKKRIYEKGPRPDLKWIKQIEKDLRQAAQNPLEFFTLKRDELRNLIQEKIYDEKHWEKVLNKYIKPKAQECIPIIKKKYNAFKQKQKPSDEEILELYQIIQNPYKCPECKKLLKVDLSKLPPSQKKSKSSSVI